MSICLALAMLFIVYGSGAVSGYSLRVYQERRSVREARTKAINAYFGRMENREEW